MIPRGRGAATLAALALGLLAAAPAQAGDWPLWGDGPGRNMVSTERGLPASFSPGKPGADGGAIDPKTTKGVRWVVKLGSQTYGNPTIAGGRVYVGTNNEHPRNPARRGDYGVVQAFDEKTGAFQWQLTVPKLGAGKVNDWEYLGICSSPAVDGDRVFVVTNRGEVVALDAKGLTDGNGGPFTDEAAYVAGPGKPKATLAPTDADILWRYDMRTELGVFPHNITSSSVLLHGGVLYVTTSNGVDWSHLNIPNPEAPTLIALDAKTGALLAEEASQISRRTLHANWSSPAWAPAGGGQVVFGAGDGFVYGFDPKPVEDDDGLMIFRELWRADANLPEYRVKDGKKMKYARRKGPSEIIATPVVVNDHVYVAIGQDPEHGEGVGNLVRIDPTQRGDITAKGVTWSYPAVGRTVSTVAVAGGIVYAAGYDGRVHAVDEATGKGLWVHDTESHIWASPFVADGKVYIGNEDGVLTVLAAGRKKKILATVSLRAPIYASVVAANGALYVASQTDLYAVGK